MNILNFARTLRKNQTATENLLWQHLRAKRLNGFKFRRQYPVDPYIVDFINLESRLIIELDGGQHNEDSKRLYDQKRTSFLEVNGFKVIRFWDNEVHFNLVGVLETILKHLGTSP